MINYEEYIKELILKAKEYFPECKVEVNKTNTGDLRLYITKALTYYKPFINNHITQDYWKTEYIAVGYMYSIWDLNQNYISNNYNFDSLQKELHLYEKTFYEKLENN